MRKALTCSILVLLIAGGVLAQSNYVAELAKWRAAHEVELRADGGWLSVAGLFWLKQGVNTVGTGSKYDVELTPRFKGGKFGDITLRGEDAVLTLAQGVVAMSGMPKTSVLTGEQIKAPVALIPDDPGPATVIKVGSQSFYLIKRNGRLGVRLKDAENPSRKNFKGERWYPVDPRYRIVADYEPYAEPKAVKVPNVLGGEFDYKAPGLLRFTLGGKEVTLMPVVEDDHLFIIFKDPTSRTTTYGAGRFLYADVAKDGKVVLDFNKAENPPCAFTEFATCPLPPQQNRLDVPIPAGEKRNH
jgi:uncharacterized protein (DUF1684 family)